MRQTIVVFGLVFYRYGHQSGPNNYASWALFKPLKQEDLKLPPPTLIPMGSILPQAPLPTEPIHIEWLLAMGAPPCQVCPRRVSFFRAHPRTMMVDGRKDKKNTQSVT